MKFVSSLPFLSNRKSVFRVSWQLMIIAAIVYTTVEAPLAFVLNSATKEHHLWWDGIISFILLLDVILNASGKLKIAEEEIAHLSNVKHDHTPYWKTRWLPIDLLGTIPFDILGAYFGFSHYAKLFRLVRIIRIIRVFRFMKKLTYMAVIPKGFKLVSILCVVFLGLHLVACGWMYIYPNLGGDIDGITFYNRSFYWALTTITTIGYGDITPTSNGGRVFTMFIMLAGVAFYGVVIGNVSRLMMIADRRKEANREKINEMHMFMKHYRIPLSLQKQVFGFYAHILEKRFSENDSQILHELPQALQNDMQVYMKMKLISNVPIFDGLRLACLKMIAGRLKQSLFTPNSSIIKTGDIGSEMFIIGHGSVDVFVEEKCVNTLKEGQIFGEIALLQEITRTADVKAQSYCDLYTLEKDDFREIVKKFPELKEAFKSVYKRRSDTKKNGSRREIQTHTVKKKAA